MRRKLTQKERKIVYEKTNGHCAYCGCEIPFKGFHADHVKCMRNNENVDTVDNMLPSCRSCNQYKSTYDLELFREQLGKIPDRLARDVSTYNIAKRYGMVTEHREPIEFYFEVMERLEPELKRIGRIIDGMTADELKEALGIQEVHN